MKVTNEVLIAIMKKDPEEYDCEAREILLIIKNYASDLLEARAQNDELLALMEEFCVRVEKGEVRSAKTYTKFRAAIAKMEAHDASGEN